MVEFGSSAWLRMFAFACAVASPACDGFDESLLRRATERSRVDGGPHSGDGGVGDGGSDAGRDGGAADECKPPRPRCSRPNALTACASGECLLVECEAPFVDCDGEAGNGCEATLESVAHCGLCGAACALPNARAACEAGTCVFEACLPGFGDCDGEGGNGCEVSLDTIADCGACARTCSPPENAAPGCNGRVCGVGACLGPFGDCDGEVENGCEEPLRSNAHCGGCDLACAPANALGECAGGSCAVVSCTGDHVDCNGRAGDGCETTLRTAQHCGACGAGCDLPRATAITCDGSVGGCAVDHACDRSGNGCVDGAPENGCVPGFGDCDGLGDSGCETPLDTLGNCGKCGKACAAANASSTCERGECEVTGCQPGFGTCTSAQCASLAGDPSHCGECERACSGATPNCAGGACTGQVCPPGTADCNGAAGDGCEATLDQPSRCGLCGVSCGPYPHATAHCDAGRCAIEDCDAGYRDCDGAVSNGCEVNIRTLLSCGACGQSCALPFAEESCASGSCELVQCQAERADCDGQAANGCETSTALPDNCGACGNDCRGRPHVQSAGCDEGACELVCEPGYGDCDGEVENGCEANLASAAYCGGCGNDCSALPQVSAAVCEDGARCDELVCDAGYADCDGNPANGCERRIDTLSDCGACDAPCAPAHAAGACMLGACGIASCDSGYADCNRDPGDGCEASLGAPAHCGSCGNACAEGLTCTNGTCVCTADAQCGHPSFDCCDSQCVNTNSVCSLWPCPVRSTARPRQNCGGCGVTCPLFCCGALGE